MVWSMNPLTGWDQMRNDLNSLLNRREYAQREPSFPLVNAYETSDIITVVAEIPGVHKNDISIVMENGTLTFSGKRLNKTSEKNSALLRNERIAGDFEKSIKIPVKVNESAISAQFKDGIITVLLPKAEDAKPKSIQIN
jgi:HSP20 family protein